MGKVSTGVLQGVALGIIKNNLRNSFDIVSHWFFKDYMMLDAKKYHFICLGNNTENKTFLFNINLMENSNEQKILGLIIANQLNFKSQVNELCNKVSQKIGALCRLLSYLKNYQKSNFQIDYFPLVWILYSVTANNMSSDICNYLGQS